MEELLNVGVRNEAWEMFPEPNKVHQVTLGPVLRQQWGSTRPNLATEKKLRQQSLFCPPSCPQEGVVTPPPTYRAFWALPHYLHFTERESNPLNKDGTSPVAPRPDSSNYRLTLLSTMG